MKKYTVISIVSALILVGMSQNAQIVLAEDVTAIIPATVGSNSAEVITTVDTSAPVPVSVGSNSSETGAIIPATTGTGSNETGAIIPNTNGTGSNETGAIIPNTNGTGSNETGPILPNTIGSNGDETGTTPVVPPVTPPVTPPGGGGGGGNGGGGSSIGSGSSSGSSSSGGLVLLSQATPVVTISTSTCPLVTDYLKFGNDNDPAQVTKLQIFLKNVEELDVDVNGKFDQKTEDAVKAFQLMYLPTILGPWDATRATGFVYITTLKKINEISCNTKAFTLTADEQAIISAYIADNGSADQTVIGQNDNNSTTTGTLEIGITDEQNDNTAAVAQASILSRLWDFIKNLFR